MMNSSDPWDGLAASWRETGNTAPADDVARIVETMQRRGTRRLWLVAALETAIVAGIVAFTASTLMRGPDTFEIVHLIAVWVVLVVALGFAIENRRGLWRPDGESTADYLSLCGERARRKLRTARFVLQLVLVQTIFVLALVGWKATRAGDRSGLLENAALSLVAGVSASAPHPAAGDMLIRNVTVIDGTGSAPRGPLSVLVADGRIVALDSPAVIEAPTGALVIDGTGKFLIPGLIDMHAHVTLGPVRVEVADGVPTMRVEEEPELPGASCELLLEHGITTIRDPGGDTERVVGLRDDIAAGRRAGPRMFVAGKVIDRTPFEGLTENFADEAELRALIRAQAAAGVDFIKLYVTLTPDLMAVAIDEAHRAGVGTIAHTLMTSWTDAASAGLDGIVHILPGNSGLLPEEARAQYMQDMTTGTQFMFTWFEYVDLDGPAIQEMIAALVEHDVTVDPTLVMWETVVRGDDPQVVQSPWLGRVPGSMLENWQTTFHMNPGWAAADFERGREAFVVALDLARRLHEAGVVLTAGTDANNPWVVPGVSLHRELELLVEAGISPLEVLTIATRNGAKVLGVLDEIGTIEVGKVADLVLLTHNPVVDISATRSIVEVMQAGRVVTKAGIVVATR